MTSFFLARENAGSAHGPKIIGVKVLNYMPAKIVKLTMRFTIHTTFATIEMTENSVLIWVQLKYSMIIDL